VLAPLQREDGIPPAQMEYKLRRMVNDYLQPPKVTRKMEIGLDRFAEIRQDLDMLCAKDAHELMRATELQFILDCAEMAAHASLYRTESRWGLYHYRVDYPQIDEDNWFVHVQTVKGENDQPTCFKREIDPYVVELDESEKDAYQKLRVGSSTAEV
jgi:succinate dehydrogenase/fumarate reductase flavoprotein subunit